MLEGLQRRREVVAGGGLYRRITRPAWASGATFAPTRLLLLLALVGVFVAGGVSIARPAAADTADLQRHLTRLVNASRTQAGKPPLLISAGLRGIAKDWSSVMARRDQLTHNPRRAQQVERRVTRKWVHLGENIGYAIDSDATLKQLAGRIHSMLMRSPGHRANVLGDFGRVGIGVRVTGEGKLWVTQVFMKRR